MRPTWTGAKAPAIDAFAAERGLACLASIIRARGSSDGDFADGTLDRGSRKRWRSLDSSRRGPFLPVGSSMGGWLALHLALRAARARGRRWSGSPPRPISPNGASPRARSRQIVREGLLEEENPYGAEPSRVHRGFWESGQELRLLEHPIAIDCPVRLVHGEDDPEVPLDIAYRLMRQLRSADVQLTIIKGGGHRLSEPHEIARDPCAPSRACWRPDR